jgi:hypothetical protein
MSNAKRSRLQSVLNKLAKVSLVVSIATWLGLILALGTR